MAQFSNSQRNTYSGDRMKDALVGFVYVTAFILVSWGCGTLIGLAIGSAAKEYEDRRPVPVWYCIEGKLYEKIGDTYTSIVPARTCLPVTKD
jgi:hypothetical protein